MNSNVEQKIRQRAHQIWEEEGKPLGQERAHWDRASREIAEETEDHASERDDDSEEVNTTVSGASDRQNSEATKEDPELSGVTRGGGVKPQQSDEA
jgi:hypothetical protein